MNGPGSEYSSARPLPKNILHYRIVQRLGRGGMGEVLLAEDTRLERQVAIKRLNRKREGDSMHRARFQREARLAASLNHPHIVQIHDFFEFENSDYLVMEYVAGITLKVWLDRGQSLQDIFSVFRQVALGLAHAHRIGVIHRDLKTENVLIAPAGTAKITDFGLARRESPGSQEASLTESHMMIGTMRTMSPEQARGEDVNGRSDFFSLGVLFYESLTGQSPFLGENPLDTLNRIGHHQPPAPMKLNPAIPAELSEMVMGMLGKEPEARPDLVGETLPLLEVLAHKLTPQNKSLDWNAATTVMTETQPDQKKQTPKGLHRVWWLVALIVLGLLGIMLFKDRFDPQPTRTVYVAVFEPRLEGDESIADAAMQSGVRVAILRGLLAKQYIAALPVDELDREPGPLLSRAEALGSDEIITSRLVCHQGGCDLTLSRMVAGDGKVLWTKQFQVPKAMPATLARVVNARIQEAFNDFPNRKDGVSFQVQEQDYAAFLNLYMAYAKERDQMSLPELLEKLKEVQFGSPDFLDAYLLETRVALNLFNESRNQVHLERARAAATKATKIAPNIPDAFYALLECAIEVPAWDQAKDILVDLERLDPGNARLNKYKAQILEAEGKSDEALTEMRKAANLHPSWRILYGLATMETRLGQVDAARQTYGKLLSRAPDNYFGQIFGGQMEMLHGDISKAIERFERLVAQSPGFVEWSALGLAHLLAGEYSSARKAFEAALALSTENQLARLNLADTYLVTGKEAEALALYRVVVDGLSSTSDDWQEQSARAQAYARLDETDKAVVAINQALKLAPNESQTAYEAAIVYALLGDHASAAYHVERAINAGYKSRWFGLPAFKNLLRDARFPVVAKLNRSLASDSVDHAEP